MIYIVTALKPEAQAFVEFYKLSKSKLGTHTLFSNLNIKLIIGGMGVINAREATQTLINHFDITDDDIYLNVGICGASKMYEIGELLSIGSIIYEEQVYSFEGSKKEILCVNTEATSPLHNIVDMESYGFYDAVIHSPAIKNFYIFKIVSDHFQPKKVTKEKTKSLLFNVINDIQTIIQD
ncbi:MAG: hypothetical protein QM497_06940 [Sulfurimonas sp.]